MKSAGPEPGTRKSPQTSGSPARRAQQDSPLRRTLCSARKVPSRAPLPSEPSDWWRGPRDPEVVLSGEGCPSGSVGSPFGSGSLPLPLPGAPRGRSSWRCRILTVAFPRVCKCGGGRSAGHGYGVSQEGAPLGPWIGWDLLWDGGEELAWAPGYLRNPRPGRRWAPPLSLPRV